MSKEMQNSVKPAGTRSGAMYGICKVQNSKKMSASYFGPYLLALRTPAYNYAKILVPILNFWTKNEYTVKDSFQFNKEICEQDPTLSIGIFDADSLFTNICFDETIDATVSCLETLILLKVLQSLMFHYEGVLFYI